MFPKDMPAHGTKLNVVARELRKLHGDDPAAKVVVFVQWVDIERKVSGAFDDYSISHLRGAPKGVRRKRR